MQTPVFPSKLIPVEDTHLLPDDVKEELIQYLDFGDVPSEFLAAIIKNDLRAAILSSNGKAYYRCIGDIVLILYQYAPAVSWGSEAALHRWQGRLQVMRSAS